MNESKVRRYRVQGVLVWIGLVGCAFGLLAGWFEITRLEPLEGWRFLWGYGAFMGVVFRLHLMVGLVVCGAGVWALWYGRVRSAAVMLMVFAALGVLGVYWPRERERDDRPSLLVMSANLLYSRADMVALRRQIEEHQPDVVLLQEYGPVVDEACGPWLRGMFPHHVVATREDAFGQAVYSRLVFDGAPRVVPPGMTLPQISVNVLWETVPLHVTNVHLLPPMVSLANEHRVQAGVLAAWLAAAAARGDVIAGGDWNATWNTAQMRVLREAGFEESHAAAGSGRGSTWPRTGVLAFGPGIRLDHVAMSEGLECVESWVGGDVGSDHAPVFARLVRRRENR